MEAAIVPKNQPAPAPSFTGAAFVGIAGFCAVRLIAVAGFAGGVRRILRIGLGGVVRFWRLLVQDHILTEPHFAELSEEFLTG